MQKLISLNEAGRRIGQEHPRAKLLDREVDQVLDLLESGLSYAAVAEKMEVSKSCVAHIATGRRRSQVVARTVRVNVAAAAPLAPEKVTRTPALTASCVQPLHSLAQRVFPKSEMFRLGRGWMCAACHAGKASGVPKKAKRPRVLTESELRYKHAKFQFFD